MDSLDLHTRSTESPLFNDPEFYNIVSTKNFEVVPLKFDAGIGRGFFLGNGKWIAYRRNYFSASFVVSFAAAAEGELCISYDGAHLQQIQGFSVTLSAKVHGTNDETVELSKLRPKRDNLDEIGPDRITWFPPRPNATDEDKDGQHEDAVSENIFSKNDGGRNISFSHMFEYIQFRRGTREVGTSTARQYFNLIFDLHTQVSGGENVEDLQWVRIARRTSEPLIIRALSPADYMDE